MSILDITIAVISYNTYTANPIQPQISHLTFVIPIQMMKVLYRTNRLALNTTAYIRLKAIKIGSIVYKSV
jgi:hypothetical protein